MSGIQETVASLTWRHEGTDDSAPHQDARTYHSSMATLLPSPQAGSQGI
jgi:hypothetical protein